MIEQPLVRMMPAYSAPMPLWGDWQDLSCRSCWLAG